MHRSSGIQDPQCGLEPGDRQSTSSSACHQGEERTLLDRGPGIHHTLHENRKARPDRSARKRARKCLGVDEDTPTPLDKQLYDACKNAESSMLEMPLQFTRMIMIFILVNIEVFEIKRLDASSSHK